MPAHSAVLERGKRRGAGLGVETVDEQDAVEVVGLVLDGAGQQVRALDAHRVAVHVPAGGDHVQVPAAVAAEAGDRQAALGAFLGLLADRGRRRG